MRKNTDKMPTHHAIDCQSQWYTGPPSRSARTALTVTLRGCSRAKACSQPGMVFTGTIAELAKTRMKNGRIPATWAVSGSFVSRPTVAYTHGTVPSGEPRRGRQV